MPDENINTAAPEAAGVPSDRELIEKLLDSQKKELYGSRIRTVIIILFLITAMTIGVFVVKAYTAVNQAAKVLEENVGKLGPDDISNAVTALTGAANAMRALDTDTLNDAIAALETAADHFSALNIDELNEAIAALSEAAENLSELDTEEINELIASLNSTAESLETAATNLKNLFSFGRN